MNKRIQNTYRPDYVSPPGETLQETLDALGMSQAAFAQRTGRPKKTINEIIRGKATITPETALQFEKVLGLSASFWMRRESNYREALARQQEQLALAKQADILKRFPLREMKRRGFLPTTASPVQQLDLLLKFFGVASAEQLRSYCEPQPAFSFRKAHNHNPAAAAAWLRIGESEAQRMPCAAYDEEKFQAALRQVRTLTLEAPEVFQPQMARLCANAGVAVVFVREFPGAGISGATRWLKVDKAMVQLSLRYKTDDQLWFTFFHEAAHVLLHGRSEVFIENEVMIGQKEDQANRFAADWLIPPAQLAVFVTAAGKHFSKAQIREFAQQLGIAPGIVVGRLQHEGCLPRTHCNDLKRKLIWAV
ncbi:MAG: HigA family addiction module antidote protein [Acidobacteria bacterium]|nr:HigA family addiction module antidote protein [Acidobacteriota bacterium]